MYMSDQEQKQLLKDWWKKYGSSILVAIFAFVVSNFVWQSWHKYKAQKAEQASIAFTQMLTAIEQKKPTEAQLFAKRLKEDFTHSPYASFAALSLAKNEVAAKNLDKALVQLNWVIKNAKDSSLKQIARIRAARILLELHKPQESLHILADIDSKLFLPLILEVKGDALLALQKPAEAAATYKEALAMTNGAKSPLLQMKVTQ